MFNFLKDVTKGHFFILRAYWWYQFWYGTGSWYSTLFRIQFRHLAEALIWSDLENHIHRMQIADSVVPLESFTAKSRTINHLKSLK